MSGCAVHALPLPPPAPLSAPPLRRHGVSSPARCLPRRAVPCRRGAVGAQPLLQCTAAAGGAAPAGAAVRHGKPRARWAVYWVGWGGWGCAAGAGRAWAYACSAGTVGTLWRAWQAEGELCVPPARLPAPLRRPGVDGDRGEPSHEGLLARAVAVCGPGGPGGLAVFLQGRLVVGLRALGRAGWGAGQVHASWQRAGTCHPPATLITAQPPPAPAPRHPRRCM